MKLQKMKDSHTIMYILENTPYIYLEIQTMQTFIHRHGTCLKASAFRELKILIQHQFVHEQHKILIRIKHIIVVISKYEKITLGNTVLQTSEELIRDNAHP